MVFEWDCDSWIKIIFCIPKPLDALNKGGWNHIIVMEPFLPNKMVINNYVNYME